MSRQRMETEEDLAEEIRYANILAGKIPGVDRIEKLSPGQYGIDWVAYNTMNQVMWWAEFKRRYNPRDYIKIKEVIGISAYKVAKLRSFAEMYPRRRALIIFGLNDCLLIGNAMSIPTGLKKGGNPEPKDEFEQEPMVYYKTPTLRQIDI